MVAAPYRVDDFLHSCLTLDDIGRRPHGSFGWPFCVAQDRVAQLDAPVANKDAWPGDELPDLVLALPAKGTLRLNLAGHHSKHRPGAPKR
jgi:hypothetical protein